ncbi:MAG: carbon monoxide dehydrogenase subunit G [Candidatus Marinimicrobia bacterium]|nr:carbon monoxide dehydrogenase subunit G [Candidatus Neomarinimicrobiota bacterium]
MAVKLERSYALEQPQGDVWEAIQNPDILAEILPNCNSLEPTGDNEFLANIEVKIGPIKGQFKSNLTLFDFNPPSGYKFKVTGNGKKGSMNGQGEIKLFPNGSGTGFTFIAKGNITGIIARVGQRLIEATGKRLMDQGFENFKNRVMGNVVA